MGRTMATGLALGLLFGAACGLEEELEHEPCAVDDDCWHTQHCARTPEEAQLGLSGMCLPKGDDCAFGAQLGCSCMPEQFEADCTTAISFSHEDTYPEMTCEPELLVCVAVTEESES